MLVRVKRTGGLAGFDEELGTIDTSSLNEEMAAQIEQSVDELSRLVAADEDPGIGADMLRYEIEIQDEHVTRRAVVVDDGDLERPALRVAHRLIDALGAAR